MDSNNGNAADAGGSGQPWYVTGGEPADLLGSATPEERAGTTGFGVDPVPAPGGSAGARWSGRRATIVGAVLAGVAATALGVGVVEASGSGGSASAAGSSPAGGFPGGFPGGMTGPVPGGTGGTGTQSGGVPGGRDGETHVTGTITAVTAASVTVRSTGGGTATYAVNSATQVLDDGKTVAVTALRAGEQVLVHAFPAASGTAYAERVLAGSSATSGPMGGMPPGGPAGGTGGGPQSGTTTTT